MTIELRTQPAPTLDPRIEEELLLMYPRHFLLWEPRHERLDEERWDPRWEIWIELTDVAHPEAKHQLDPGRDRWNTDAQCWMRRLMAYETEDYKFAPVDERLLIGLEMADTWENHRFYEDHIDEPSAAAEVAEQKKIRDIYKDATNYYNRYNSPMVGRHVNSGWRWRQS